METGAILGGLSMVCAACAGFSLIVLVEDKLFSEKKRALATRVEKETFKQGVLPRRVRNGFPFCFPLAQALLKVARIKKLAAESVLLLGERGWATTEVALLSVVIVATFVIGTIIGVVFGSLVSAIAVWICALAIVATCLKTAWEKRACAMRDAVPDVLRAMGVCFRAGLSLMQTLEQVAVEAHGSLKVLFLKSAHQLEIGNTTSAALGVFRREKLVPELSFVAVALDVQHQTGGSMEQVLASARDTVESELALARSLRVQTAQAKLSARIVTIMPFVLIALFSLMSSDFLMPFFSSALGVFLLIAALGMQAAGVIMVHRMLQVEVL